MCQLLSKLGKPNFWKHRFSGENKNKKQTNKTTTTKSWLQILTIIPVSEGLSLGGKWRECHKGVRGHMQKERQKWPINGHKFNIFHLKLFPRGFHGSCFNFSIWGRRSCMMTYPVICSVKFLLVGVFCFLLYEVGQ